MSRNGSGTYTLPAGNPVVTGTTITSSWANTTMQNIADALTQSVASDGQTPMSGALNMATSKIINVGTPTLSTDAVTKAYADALIGAGGVGVFSSLTDTGLTATRVTYATTGGLLTDSANMTFNGTTLTAGGLTTTGATSTGTLSASGVATFSAGTVSLPAITTTGDTNTGIYFPAADTIAFTEGGVESMRIDSSGNVGIGTSSPAVKLSFGTQFIGNNGYANAVRVYDDGAASTSQTSNSYGIGFVNNTQLSFTAGTGGLHTWFTNNTERMRIDSSGRLLINATATSAFFDGNLNVAGSSSFKAVSGAAQVPLFAWNDATSGDNNFILFGTEASFTTRGSITYNRGAGLTAYNVTSDYRAKDIISPVLDSGEVIDSVPVYMGKMKGATQARPMFIAHETPDYAHTGEKDAVDKDGNPVYQQMDASSLVPVLWAEIQSLRKRVAQLESK
jgi:hypothetical protein